MGRTQQQIQALRQIQVGVSGVFWDSLSALED